MANAVFIVIAGSGVIDSVTRSIDGAAHAAAALGDEPSVAGETLTIDGLFEAIASGRGVAIVEYAGGAASARVERHAVTI